MVEVAASSAAYDLHEKLRVYRRNGVQEYLVWRVYDGELDWFELQEGRYARLMTDATPYTHKSIRWIVSASNGAIKTVSSSRKKPHGAHLPSTSS